MDGGYCVRGDGGRGTEAAHTIRVGSTVSRDTGEDLGRGPGVNGAEAACTGMAWARAAGGGGEWRHLRDWRIFREGEAEVSRARQPGKGLTWIAYDA
jgi:hypothetical protein